MKKCECWEEGEREPRNGGRRRNVTRKRVRGREERKGEATQGGLAIARTLAPHPPPPDSCSSPAAAGDSDLSEGSTPLPATAAAVLLPGTADSSAAPRPAAGTDPEDLGVVAAAAGGGVGSDAGGKKKVSAG